MTGRRLFLSGLFVLISGCATDSEKADTLDVCDDSSIVAIDGIYPREALCNCIEGTVWVDFVVTEEGVPTDIVVIKSEPPDVFDDTAIRALRGWRFTPYMIDGVPVPRKVAQAIEFGLPDDCKID